MDGFYIGRYEVGDGDLKNSFRNSNSGYLHTPVSMQGRAPYVYITWYQAYDLSKQFSKKNESVHTSLIFGCLWDATLEYLVEVGNKTYAEIVDSTSWGNYYDAEFSYTSFSGLISTKSATTSYSYIYNVIIPTGSTEYTEVCNIYDLAGNVSEWTQENVSAKYRRRRFLQF